MPEVSTYRRGHWAIVEEQGGAPELVWLAVKFIGHMCHTKVVIKGGDEPAMPALAARVQELRVHPTVIEEAPKDVPQSNELAERYLQTARFVPHGTECVGAQDWGDCPG